MEKTGESCKFQLSCEKLTNCMVDRCPRKNKNLLRDRFVNFNPENKLLRTSLCAGFLEMKCQDWNDLPENKKYLAVW